MSHESEQLDRLLADVLLSAKYRSISPELVARIGRRELANRRSLKEAVKATKNKLHQVAGAFLDTRPPYEEWLTQLEASAALDHANSTLNTQHSKLQAAGLDVMRHHASTRERMPILRTFYATVLAELPPIRSVLDVACGLNPLAAGWMPLAPSASYRACDLYADMVAFLARFFELSQIDGQAFVCDLVGDPPTEPADLALVLKALPVLEQIERGAGLRLLQTLNCPYLLVSFPDRSLGGRAKGMAENYEQQFHALTNGQGWQITRFAFPGELAFLVCK